MYFGRSENRIKNPYNLSDMYKAYADDNKGNVLYLIDKNKFYDICSEYYNEVVKSILYDGKEFKMPFSIGEIYIRKYKPQLSDIKKRTSFIDWKNTAKLGKIVYHLNEHSDGFKYTIKWKKKKNMIRYIDIYKFVPTRNFKRTLASIIKNKESDYFEID